MGRLFRFLLKLAAEEFYGDIKIHFSKGRIHGQIEVHQAHLEDTLPEPDVKDEAYQLVLAEAVRGCALENLPAALDRRRR